MRWLWRHLRSEKPFPLAMLAMFGLLMIVTGSTTATSTALGRWLSIGLIIAGVAYVAVFIPLGVRAVRNRPRTRAADDVDQTGSPRA